MESTRPWMATVALRGHVVEPSLFSLALAARAPSGVATRLVAACACRASSRAHAYDELRVPLYRWRCGPGPKLRPLRLAPLFSLAAIPYADGPRSSRSTTRLSRSALTHCASTGSGPSTVPATRSLEPALPSSLVDSRFFFRRRYLPAREPDTTSDIRTPCTSRRSCLLELVLAGDRLQFPGEAGMARVPVRRAAVNVLARRECTLKRLFPLEEVELDQSARVHSGHPRARATSDRLLGSAPRLLKRTRAGASRLFASFTTSADARRRPAHSAPSSDPSTLVRGHRPHRPPQAHSPHRSALPPRPRPRPSSPPRHLLRRHAARLVLTHPRFSRPRPRPAPSSTCRQGARLRLDPLPPRQGQAPPQAVAAPALVAPSAWHQAADGGAGPVVRARRHRCVRRQLWAGHRHSVRSRQLCVMLSSSSGRLEARADERSRRWPHWQRLPVLPPQLDRRRRLPGRSVHLELRPRLLVGRLDVVLHQHGDRHAQLRQRRADLLDADGHGRRHVPRGLLPVDELRQGLQLPRRDVRRRAVLVRPEELRATGTRLPYGVRERPRERVRRWAVPGRDVRRGVPVGRRGGRVHEERARRRLVRPSPNLLLGLAGVLSSSRRITDAFPALFFRAAPVETTRRASPASVSRCSRPGRRRPSQTRSTALHPSSRPPSSPTTLSRLQHTP